MKTNLTAERAHELLVFDQVSGKLTRRVSLSQSTRVGETAGYIHPTKGYVNLYVDGHRFLAHRVVWLMMTGSWPKTGIDHIDGDKTNNRWSNLREATAGENNQNMRAVSSNSSGLLGVSWMTGAKKWRAQICLGRKVTYLGLFEDKEDAHRAYIAAKRAAHPFCTI